MGFLRGLDSDLLNPTGLWRHLVGGWDAELRSGVTHVPCWASLTALLSPQL